jgi:hypothetical protein
MRVTASNVALTVCPKKALDHVAFAATFVIDRRDCYLFAVVSEGWDQTPALRAVCHDGFWWQSGSATRVAAR